MDISIASLIAGAGIGSLIGGCTNQLAVTMLFRPYYEKKLFGVRIPFTPGMIPRRRAALAQDIGSMVSSHLLTGKEFTDRLEDPQMRHHLQTVFKDLLTSVYAMPLRDIVKQGADADWDQISDDACRRLEMFLHTLPDDPVFRESLKKLIDSPLPESLMDKITGSISLPFSTAALLGTIIPMLIKKGIYFGLLYYLKDRQTISSIMTSLRPMVQERIGRVTPSDYFDEETIEWLSQRLTDKSIQWFSENADSLIEKLDIEKMVIEKINSVSDPELHDMVQGTTRKELRAITVLGFVLGACVGVLNPILNSFL
jgi:uncharacterized membrane protein YheB (UPF0754 family)